MSLKVLSLIISTLVNIAIGTYVLFKGRRKTVNRSLSLLVYNFAVWSLFNLLVTVSRDVRWVTIFGQLCFAIGVSLPITILYFSTVFPKPPPGRNRLNYGIPALNYGIVILGGVLFFLSFTRFIQEDVYLQDGVFRPKVGVLYPLLVAYEIGSVSLCLSYLFKKWKKTKLGIEAVQLKALFTGIFLCTSLAIITNAILPALGFPQLVSIGPTFSVIIISSVAYSIVKYHLFDITIVIKKTAIYALLTGSVTAFYIISVLLAERLFRGVVGYQTFLPAVLAALIVAFVFLPLRDKVQEFVDRVFYRKKYEYQKVLKETGRELARVLSLSELLSMILRRITESVGIERASIWLKEGDCYTVGSEIGLAEAQSEVVLRKDSSLIEWIVRREEVIIREELERLRSTPVVREVDDMLKKVGAEIAIPISREKELTGIIFLGNKQSGDIFTQEDIDLFLTLANQASVAIDNAKLYTRMEEAKIYQENILRNLTGGVITIDERGKVVIFNEKAQELTGFSSDAVGKPFKQAVKDPIRKLIEDTLNRDWGYAQQKVDYIKAESVSVPLAVSTTPLKDAAGKVSGAVVVLVDLTEIKSLEQELYRAEKLASLGTLAAGMAHEIKNPLVSIKTFLDLLPGKFSDKEFREKFSKVAAGEVRRINHIVEQLLDFAHPRPANYQLISIHEVIDGTLTFLSAQLNKKSIKVVKNYARDALQIYADEDKMKQVFLNLFLNGMESMDGGGTLIVDTAFRKHDRLLDEDELIVEIRDTGEGIPPDVLPGIFDPFFSTKKTGTGLGLAMVHRIITDHGGIVGVKETKLGKGTCFSLNLPVRRETKASEQ